MRNEYHDAKGWKTWYESIEPIESEDSLLKQINTAGVRTEKQAPLEAEAKGRFDAPCRPKKTLMKFAVTGNLKKAKEEDLLDRVWVLYGQGPNAGKNRVGESIIDEAPTMK